MVGPERVLLRDQHRYIAHPHMVRLSDGSWLLVATCGPRRAVTLHPPLDPEFINVCIWSDDEGETWSDPAPAPGYSMSGTECSGLTALPDGGVLLNQWRFRWYAETMAAGFDARPGEPILATAADLQTELKASLELDGAAPSGFIRWARGGGTTSVWRSDSGGLRWQHLADPDLQPFQGGYGLRGGVFAANGDLLLPLTDPPHYRSVFLIRSRDDGRSWGAPECVAQDPSCAFEEPSGVLLADGTLLMLLRENASRQLHTTRSSDHGATWSPPRPVSLAGFPAHVLARADGRLAALTAIRNEPGAILLAMSTDMGATWSDPTVVAGDLGTRDLGYPTGVLTHDDSIFAAYYRRDALGVTGVYARRVQVSHHA